MRDDVKTGYHNKNGSVSAMMLQEEKAALSPRFPQEHNQSLIINIQDSSILEPHQDNYEPVHVQQTLGMVR
jgi:hypothetical protein